MGLEVATYISQLVTTNPVGATDPKSQGDDHLRLLKSTIKNTFPNFTAAALASTQAQIDSVASSATPTWTSTDAGATAAPSAILDRNSASPAANDLIGQYLFRGRSSTAVTRDYASISGQILDPTNTSEDGTILFNRMVAGTLTTGMTLGTVGLGIGIGVAQAMLHVGAGADAPVTSGTGIYGSNAGATAIVARDSTNNIEAFMNAGTANVSFGSQTAHDVLLSRGNTTVATIGSTLVTLASNIGIQFAGTGAATTRTNLGLGTAAIVNTGTSGATIPLLNGNNVWSGTAEFDATVNFDGAADFDGAVDFSALVTLSVGQLKFPASQNPSADANTLDDYQEGTFTPTIAFGGSSTGVTYTTQDGKFTKIGNAVHYQLEIRLTSNGSGVGNAVIGGLPFTSSDLTPATVGFYSDMAAINNGVWALIQAAATTINLYHDDGAAPHSATPLTNSNFIDTGRIILAGTYFV